MQLTCREPIVTYVMSKSLVLLVDMLTVAQMDWMIGLLLWKKRYYMAVQCTGILSNDQQ